MIKEISKYIVLIFIGVAVLSCNKKDIYFSYQTVSASGWNKDSLLTYNVAIRDKTLPYNLYINVRHHGNYPYQNIWLFLQQMNPDSAITKDTIEAYLADQYGKWLGSGAGNLKEMPIIYKKQVQFPDTGVYRFKIRQGMRDSLLQGINDVGIRIEKVD